MKPRIAVFYNHSMPSTIKLEKQVKESEEIGADIIYNWDYFYPL